MRSCCGALASLTRRVSFQRDNAISNVWGEAREHLRLATGAINAGFEVELSAEDLRQCQIALGRITGTVSSDDLLGEIFSSFCIGK